MTELYILALVFLVASALGILLRRLHQPLIVAYIASGALLSATGIVKSEQLVFLKFLPEIGLAFLLFLVGMELDLREIKSLGKNVLIAAFGQVTFTAIVLFLFWQALPGAALSKLFLGVAFSLSSTILVVKLLLENKELASLHGKLAIGVLLLEDILAILVLMFLSNSAAGLNISSIALILVKGGVLIWLALISGKKLIPKLLSYTADNGELLIITAISWCLLFVSLSLLLGFSTGIGAFLAGISLAQSVYRTAVSGRVKPLRDFFIMIFFVDLGVSLFPINSNFPWLVTAILVVYTVLIKPLIFFLIFTALSFRVHTSFKTAILLSSISEFSLIILFTARSGNLIAPELIAPLAFATVSSYIFSSFLITHSRSLYNLFGRHLKILERGKTISFDFLPKETGQYQNHAVLIGCHRSGEIILKNLRKTFGDNLVVVDFNPEVIAALREKFFACVYGDIADPEIAERLNLKEAKLVISTVRDLNDNLALLDRLEKIQSKAVVIITAGDTSEAIKLYERGAHHVSLPLTLEGTSISHLISDHQDDLHKLIAEREKKLGELKRISN